MMKLFTRIQMILTQTATRKAQTANRENHFQLAILVLDAGILLPRSFLLSTRQSQIALPECG
jgi:hypothetical protein